MQKSFYIETFGCQMNKNDSDLMKTSLESDGYVCAPNLESADIAVYNTCSVRAHAEERVIARIQSARKRIKQHNGTIIVAGCMAQRIGSSLLKDKIADIAIGPYQSPAINKVLDKYFAEKNKNLFVSQENDDFQSRLDFRLAEKMQPNEWRQWITITHGCENFCAYCIVPYVRGKLISFDSKEILDYARALLDKGIQEITLLGQNVNQFGQDSGDIPFYSLLEKTAKLPGLARLNFLTSHPKDFSTDIIRVIADNANISRSIHLPLQSGSDAILSAMNRSYSFSHYMKLVEEIERRLDIYALSTDLIVGFAGESIPDYEETLRAVENIRFDEAYMYAYSPREGTPAFALKELISREEKIDRLNRLIDLQRRISQEKLAARINCIEEMIPEKISRRSDGKLIGRTFLNHPVVTTGESGDIGRRLKIKVESISGSTLQGTKIA